MISVSLREFAVTGRFGPIQLGMTRDEIQTLLGTPERWGTELRREVALIWRYSEIEFHFLSHKLDMIFTDHERLTNGGDACLIDPWIIRPGLPRNEFETALRVDDVRFAVSQPAYDPRQRIVLTAGNVQFSFLEASAAESPDEELGLFAWSQRQGGTYRGYP